ncbi:MAG: GNAT family N-acetyltransferase, partial [Alphaproteobacteria bacterium]|nr:GNAT family N-acetyltransferase [Alphaproteobacteria bacterium]
AEGARAMMLEDMIVRPDHRGQGVGLALIEAAIARAAAKGCARITLLTDEDNTQAQWFYGRAGFRRSAMIPMRRAIP